jgi:tripartite-type tricarboxylate transporter receptor subunit TctC
MKMSATRLVPLGCARYMILRGACVRKALCRCLALPTMIESGFPDFATSAWTGLLAPAGTPPEVIAKLNGAVNAALRTGEMKTALDRLAGEPLGGAPTELTKVIESDIGKWAPIVKALNLQTE